MANNSLKDAIDLISIGAGRDGYRVYPGSGAMWVGNNSSLVDATFVDWGLARATATILNAVLDGRLSIADRDAP